MFKISLEKKPNSVDYDVNVRVITFAVISIVLILISIYFVRSYASKKQWVIQNMRIEANNLENSFVNDINYSQYFVNLIMNQLQSNYLSLSNIRKVLKNYVPASRFSALFGWRKYSWIDANYKETVTSTSGIEANPKEPIFIKGIIEQDNWENQIIFFINKTDFKNNTLKLISSIKDKNTKKYAGSIVLSYDTSTMIRRLYANTRNEFTNFVILNDRFEVIAQSKPNIKNIIDEKETFAPHLSEALKKIDLNNSLIPSKDISYLDMLTGINYYIRKIDDLPFILVVSLDSNEISNTILDSIIKKFVEVSVFALMFFMSVISIYRRETWLRAKAEQATIIANRATKAKTDFLAFTAHEIRSPLGFISTGSEIMTKKLFGELPPSYLAYAEGIHQNSKIILDFITDILDENQIIEGKFKTINSVTDLSEIISKAISVNKTRFNDRKVEIKVDLEDNLPQLICDQRRILQVMNNLISNAIKYSNDNTAINVSARIINEQMEIEVCDQGIGMTENEIQVALSTYGIASKKSHDLIESYGLGLPIVKMLLDAHDAQLEIKSVVNNGTRVKIIFPKDKLKYNK